MALQEGARASWLRGGWCVFKSESVLWEGLAWGCRVLGGGGQRGACPRLCAPSDSSLGFEGARPLGAIQEATSDLSGAACGTLRARIPFIKTDG